MKPLLILGVTLCALSAGCRAEPPRLEIRVLTPEAHPEQTTIAVVGIPSSYAQKSSEVPADVWPSIFRVAVLPDGQVDGQVPAVAGSYRATADGVVFTPMFGLEPGVRYRAEFDGAKLPAAAPDWKPERVVATVFLPKRELPSTTTVTHLYPSAEVVPENQLRLYIQFSAPMGRRGGLSHVHLLDDEGREVKQPFLPLEAEFWNTDRTRYTVFFDPGRVKRGILPNQQMGRPLVSGRQYTLLVDREWKDGNGVPLREVFRKTFRAAPADMRPLDPAMWRMNDPSAGTRDALIVTFPEPLDYGLLQRALGVATVDGQAVPGNATILADETKWAFTPEEPWKVGGYQLQVLTILEDMAGNRIGRAFEVDRFEQIPSAADADRIKLPIQID